MLFFCCKFVNPKGSITDNFFMKMKLNLKCAASLHLFAATLISCLFVAGCAEEEISLELENAEMPYQIVVSGGVYSVYGNQFIKLSKPVTSTDKRKYPRAKDAKIEVTDGQNTYQYYETDEPGEYKSIDKFTGEVGNVYTLKIEYEGITYFASDSMVAAKEIELDKIPITYSSCQTLHDWYRHPDEKLTVLSLGIDQQVFGCDENAIWIDSERRASNLPVKITPKYLVFCEKAFAHQSTPPQGLYPMIFNSDVLYQCSKIDTTEFVKLSVSGKYYNYLVSRFNLVEWSGGMFSTIPGNTKTNLSKGATGFFCACDVKQTSFTFDELMEHFGYDEEGDFEEYY